jgi:Domain of unknown function (DUF4160)
MPTLLRIEGFRVYITSHDLAEPVHVHVDRQAASAKFRLNPVRLASSIGYARRELWRIEQLLSENETMLAKGWNDYSGT